MAQTFRVTEFRFTVQGRFEITHQAVSSAYYVLFRGSSVERIDTPVNMALGADGPGRLTDPTPFSTSAFYRISQIARDQRLDTDRDGIDDVYELTHRQILNPLDATDAALDPDRNGRSHLEEYRNPIAPLTTVLDSSPGNGETGVAVTRETIIHLTQPLARDTIIGTDRLFAEFGGRKLLSRVELSSDRRKATLFYLEPLPGSARVRVTLNGDGLNDAQNRPVDFDADGQPGGSTVITFDTLSLTPIPGTAVIGHVFASEPQPGSDTGTNQPLAGVTITVDGMEQTLRAVTDANGSFRLSPVPAGRFFVHIDGRTVVNAAAGIRYPDMAYYPFVGKAWDAVAGRTNNLAGGRDDTPAGATGEIFLPLIRSGTLQQVSMTEDTTISFPPGVIAANPALQGVSMTVPAATLFSDDGTRGGKVGIAPVPPDRLPGPLPPGLSAPLVITVQTDGGLNFDRPAPICFPNLPDPQTGRVAAPGEKRTLFSFDHDKGIWEPVGPMTVSPDGKLVCTDPGVGIRQPGWHVPGPGGWFIKPCDSNDYVYVLVSGVGYVRVDLKRPADSDASSGGPLGTLSLLSQRLRGLQAPTGAPPKVSVLEEGSLILERLEPRHHFFSAAEATAVAAEANAWSLVFANETPPSGGAPDVFRCPDPLADPDSIRVQVVFEGPAHKFLEVESQGRPLTILSEEFVLSPGQSREFAFRQKNLDKFLFEPYRFSEGPSLEGKDVWLLSTTTDFSVPGVADQVKLPPQARGTNLWDRDLIFLARDLADRLHIRVVGPFSNGEFTVTEPAVGPDAEAFARRYSVLKQYLATLWNQPELKPDQKEQIIKLLGDTFTQEDATIQLRQDNPASELLTREDDVFYVARGRIRVTGLVSGELLYEKEVYYVRFLDVADDNHNDGTVSFARTTADAAGGAVRLRPFQVEGPPAAGVSLVFTDSTHFRATSKKFQFDPLVEADDLTTTAKVRVAPLKPDSAPVEVGELSLRGDGVKFRVYFDDEAFLRTLTDLATARLSGTSLEEKPLIDLEHLRELVLIRIKERLEELFKGFMKDPQSGSENSSGIVFIAAAELDKPHVRTAGFSREDAEVDPGEGVLGLSKGEADLAGQEMVDLLLAACEAPIPGLGSTDSAVAYFLERGGKFRDKFNRAEAAFRFSKLLNQEKSGEIYLFADNFFALHNFAPPGPPGSGFPEFRDAYAKAFAKTVAHEIAHQAGLIHTANDFQRRCVSGRIYEDVNSNDRFDPFVDGTLSGVTLVAIPTEGTNSVFAVTEGNGIYRFCDVDQDKLYRITLVAADLPEGDWKLTGDTLHPGVQLNARRELRDASGQLVARPGEMLEVGLERLGRITGHKYDDKNGNGSLDPEDRARPRGNWTINLYDDTPALVEAKKTDANGFFEFMVEPGDYSVEDALPEDFRSRNDTLRAVTVQSGGEVELDFLNYELADISGTTFRDADSDGLPDGPLGGVTVTLSGPDGTQTAVLAADGSFTFKDLRPGFYPLGQTTPSGMVMTFPGFARLPNPMGILLPSAASYLIELMSGTDVSGNDFAFGPLPPPDVDPPPPGDGGVDFGDAPDDTRAPRYPTLAANGGAAHVLDGALFLGQKADPDRDGQPNADATGDDALPGDDEDGVTFLTELKPGSAARVEVIASATGRLDAFVDFNGDGDWDDPGEQIIRSAVLALGANGLDFAVPPGATPGLTTLARFRLSSVGGLTPRGTALDGEVEDDTVTLGRAAMDFGDAPDAATTPRYPTLLANDGARHLIVSGFHLGRLVAPDAEGDGQPNATATGDDAAGGAEENGAVFDTPLIPGNVARVTVNATKAGRLDAWTDFNSDGDWSDPGEQVFRNVPLAVGDNPLAFTIPATAIPGARTFARFRLSTAGNLDFSGAAADGEVEDYQVTLADPPLDFGSAPAPYPTALAQDGARHAIVTGMFLGSRNGADDGISLAGPLLPGQTTGLTVTASVAGRLDAWIDFNGDGDWLDAGERILTGATLDPGENELTIWIPPTASVGRSFARFRFSTLGRLQPTGLSGAGEVEDFEVTISTASAGAGGFDVAGGALDPRSIAHRDAHNDIMAQGLDIEGNLRFRVSEPALRIATGLNWTLFEAEEAMLGYYLDHFLVSGGIGGVGEGLITGPTFFDTLFHPGEKFPEIGGGLLLLRSAARGLFWNKRDFGDVLVDGAGGQATSDTLELLNLGDEELVIIELRLSQAEGAGFSVTPIEPGTIVPAKRSISVQVVFDPMTTGSHAAGLRVLHDGINSPTTANLLGVGLSSRGDIFVEQHQEIASALAMGNGLILLEDFATVHNRGAGVLTVNHLRVADGGAQVIASGLPPGVGAGESLKLEPGEAFDFDLLLRVPLGNRTPVELHIGSDDPAKSSIVLPLAAAEPRSSGEFVQGRQYVAFVIPQVANSPVLRAKTDEIGDFEFFLPATVDYGFLLFDPATGLVSDVTGRGAASGARLPAPIPALRPSTSPDSDDDGLTDEIEFIVGADAAHPDTDGDAIPDGEEIRAGTDPLDGLTASVGVAAAVNLRGAARAVAVEGRLNDRGRQFAYVALDGGIGQNGLAVVDVSNPTMPIVQSVLNLPGPGTDVAFDPVRQIAVVAGFSAGLFYVDVADPAAPKQIPPLPGLITQATIAHRVRILGRFAYASLGNTISAIDLESRATLATVDIGGPALDMAFREDGEVLFVRESSSQSVHALRVNGAEIESLGSILLSNTGTSGGIGLVNDLLLTARGGPLGGFASFDASDPASLRLLSEPDNLQTALGGNDVAADGAGLAVLVGDASLGGPGVNVMDVSDPARTDSLVNRILLPQSPQSVVLGSGRAFVTAARTTTAQPEGAGLWIINYRSPDFGRVPPTVELRLPPELDADPARAGVQVIEGTVIGLQAVATDDVIVRDVDLLVNGTAVFRDGTAPYTLAFQVPAFAEGSSTLTIQARATDSGGAAGLSQIETFEIIRDVQPPEFVEVRPLDQGVVKANRPVRVEIELSEPIGATSDPGAAIRIRDASGKEHIPTSIGLDARAQRISASLAALAEGDYTLVIDGAKIRDVAGNPLGDSLFASSFSARAFTVEWINRAGGAYTDVANWSTGQLPGPTDKVFIEIDPTAEVFMGLASTVDGLNAVGGRFIVGNTTLTVNQRANLENLELRGTITGAGAVELLGRTLANGTLRGLPAGVINYGRLETISMTLVQTTLANRGEIQSVATATPFSTLVARINLNGNAVIRNEADATMELGNMDVLVTGTGNRIENDGMLLKVSDANSNNGATINAPVINQGQIQVVAGELRFTAGMTSSGGEIIDIRDRLTFAGNNQIYTFDADHRFTGGGPFQLNGSTARLVVPATRTLTTDIIGGGFQIVAGTLEVAGVFENVRNARWSGATINVTGEARNLGTFLIDGSATLSGTLVNRGLIQHTDATLRTLTLRNGTLLNDTSGTYELGRGGFSVGAGTTDNFVENRGTLRKLPGTGTSHFNMLVRNSGLLDAGNGALILSGGLTQAAGELRMNGASLTGSRTIDLQGGVLAGSGAIQAAILNSATIAPGGLNAAGTLAITGGYTQAEGGTLQIELGGTSEGQFDRLTVSGRATLAGKLTLNPLANFAPNATDTFMIMTFGSRTGEFTTVDQPFSDGTRLTLRYNVRDLTIAGP